MNRAERRRVRSAALSKAERKRQGLSVPRGPRPLLQNPRRFEMALWHTFDLAGLDGDECGYLTMLLLGPLRLQPAEALGNGVVVLSGDMPRHGAVGDNYVEHYAERISALANETMGRAIRLEHVNARYQQEAEWLIDSSALLALALINISRAATDECFAKLEKLGWRDVLLKMSSRWRDAMRSNFPPHQERLSNAVKRLIEHARLAKEDNGLGIFKNAGKKRLHRKRKARR